MLCHEKARQVNSKKCMGPARLQARAGSLQAVPHSNGKIKDKTRHFGLPSQTAFSDREFFSGMRIAHYLPLAIHSVQLLGPDGMSTAWEDIKKLEGVSVSFLEHKKSGAIGPIE